MEGIWAWLGWGLLAAMAGAALWRALRRSDEPGRLALRWLATVAIVVLMWQVAGRVLRTGGFGGYAVGFFTATMLAAGLAAGGILLAAIWGGAMGRWLARPLAGLYDGGEVEWQPAPCYSVAIAHRKQGRTAQALAAVRRELERFPDDLEGVLLLAEIQAVDQREVAAAEATLRGWLAEKHRDPGQRAIAQTKLADWHLRVARDSEGARRCLELIVREAPSSEAALLAEQRLAHLEYESRPPAGPIRLTVGAGQPVEPGVPPPVPEGSPAVEAAELEAHLRMHPHDLAARERLVLLLAWSLGRPEQAREQLEVLIGFPQVTDREVVHWLHLLADVEVRVAGDLAAGQAALERVIQRNPSGAAAEQTRRRLWFLARELNRHRGPRVIRS